MGKDSEKKAPTLEKELFGLHVKCFGTVGIHPDNSIDRPKVSLRILIFTMCDTMSCLISISRFAFENRKNILEVTEAAIPIMSLIILFAKVAAFYFKKAEIFGLIDEMRKMSANPELLDPLKYKWIKKVDRTSISIYLFSSISTGLFYCIEPIIRNVVIMLTANGEFEHELPFKAHFPLNTSFFHNYAICYTALTIATFTKVFFNGGCDSLIFSLCFSIGAHFDALKKSYDGGDKNKFIKTHQELIDFATRFRNLMRPMVFAQCSMTAAQLCVIGFQILTTDDTPLKRFKTIFYALAIVIELLLYSAGGQIVMDKSSSLTEEFYDLYKDMVVVIARSQKASEMDAWFYTANFFTFTTIMSSTLSLITVLRSFLE